MLLPYIHCIFKKNYDVYKDQNIERRNIQISRLYICNLTSKKWIEKLNLKNGDSMQIVNNPNNSITLSADSIQENQQPILKLKSKKQTL